MLISIIAQLTHITINFDMSFTIERKQTLIKTVTAVCNKRTGEQGVFWNECDDPYAIKDATKVAYVILENGSDHWSYDDLEVI
jgi:hypothetical protein